MDPRTEHRNGSGTHAGRIAAPAAAELVRAGFADEISHAARLARGMSFSDIAHAIVLCEGGEIDPQTGSCLLSGLLELHAIDAADFPWDPAIGDAFECREHLLRERIGRSASGWLSAGRPRREVFRVALRLVAREMVADLHSAVLDVAEALADQARRHRDDLCADYTYLQAAQPTTIGHLVLAWAWPLLHSARRLGAVYRSLDTSVAGAGGCAGSRWNLDRERLATLLGFAGGVEPHARVAAWQWQPYVDLLAELASLATHLSQLGQDIEILASREFGFLELADEHSRESMLMPQKRNPYGAVVLRTWAGKAAGDLAATLTVLHTGTARTDHFQLLNGRVPAALEEALGVVELARGMARALRFDTARMERAAHEGGVVAADIADTVAQHTHLDYRSAHVAVGRAIRDLAEAGHTISDLSAELVTRAAVDALGEHIDIEDSVIVGALDPAACVRSRRQTGSCSPQGMEQLLDTCARDVNNERAWSLTTRERQRAAIERLLATARANAATPRGIDPAAAKGRS